MSTPLLDPHHFAITAHSLGHHASQGRAVNRSERLSAELCRNLGVSVFGHDDGQPEKAASLLLFDLQRMNATAHGARYSTPTPKVTPPKALNSATPLPPVALLKALQAIRYNCDGGAAIGESFKSALSTCDELIETLKEYIIDGLSEYRKAEWFLTK